MNKKSAIEWLMIASHDLKSAQILFEANKYCLPSKQEIKEVIDFTEHVFLKTCEILQIELKELSK